MSGEVSARPRAGWEATRAGHQAHWLDVDGRPACTPDGLVVDSEPGTAFGRPPWPCEACHAAVLEFRERARQLGFRLDPLLTFPVEGGMRTWARVGDSDARWYSTLQHVREAVQSLEVDPDADPSVAVATAWQTANEDTVPVRLWFRAPDGGVREVTPPLTAVV